VDPLTITNHKPTEDACQLTLGELLERTPLAGELEGYFNSTPYQELLKKISAERTRAFTPLGRPGYPIEAMLKAYLAGYFIGDITSISHLIRRLQDNPIFAVICGFDIRHPLPHRTTFSRFVGKLAKHQSLVDQCRPEIVERLRALVPGFAEILSVDCTPVKSWSNPARKSDPEAGFVYKGTVEGRKKWVFGYRCFIVSDAVNELPIGIMLTHAKDTERKMLLPLLRKVKAELPWLRPSAVCCDAGFDKYDNFEGIVKEFDAEPVIALAYKSEVQGSPAAPICKADLPLIFAGWRRGQLVYRCPEEAGRAICPLPDRCPHKQIMVHPVHDYRRFGYRIPRNSPEYKQLYNRRSAAERVNSRVKGWRRLNSHRFRKRERINLHVTLSTIAMLAMALSKAEAGKLDEIRVCARKIG
jgi:hypothetical protein